MYRIQSTGQSIRLLNVSAGTTAKVSSSGLRRNAEQAVLRNAVRLTYVAIAEGWQNLSVHFKRLALDFQVCRLECGVIRNTIYGSAEKEKPNVYPIQSVALRALLDLVLPRGRNTCPEDTDLAAQTNQVGHSRFKNGTPSCLQQLRPPFRSTVT